MPHAVRSRGATRTGTTPVPRPRTRRVTSPIDAAAPPVLHRAARTLLDDLPGPAGRLAAALLDGTGRIADVPEAARALDLPEHGRYVVAAVAGGLRVPIVSGAPGCAPRLTETSAAAALEAMVHVVSTAPAVGSGLPGVRRTVSSCEAKYPGSPADSGVLSGCSAARLLGAAPERACEKGGLAGEDVVAAHRSQKNAGTGPGTPQDFTDAGRPASRSICVLKPGRKATGGLVGVEDAHRPPGVGAYPASRSS
ncbi:hypothetical protein SUDANB6_00279 [Streptomyces sp. enrichment culture]